MLAIGFRLNLFSRACNSPGLIGGIIHGTRGIMLTGGITSRDTMLLRGEGSVLPLSLGGCGSITIIKPGDGRTILNSCT